MLDNTKIEKISYEVIKTLYSRFENFPEDSTNICNAPFHTAFLKAFTNKLEDKINDIPTFISLASWFHGLNTTLGQTFFEKTAHILSDGIKKEFRDVKISIEQQTSISDIMSDLKNGVERPSLSRENGLIFLKGTKLTKDAPNFTADCYFEEGNQMVAIELKTVKPNSGVFKSEKEKILYAKAALKNLYPKMDILFYLGFPFDPQSKKPTGYNKTAFFDYSIDFKKFFEPNEVLLAGELWDYLSGDTDTMQQILSIINTIATPDFLANYEFLNAYENKGNKRSQYLRLLLKWNLYSEHYLVENEEKIIKETNSNRRLARIFNQPVFKNSGEYNYERYQKIKDVLL